MSVFTSMTGSTEKINLMKYRYCIPENTIFDKIILGKIKNLCEKHS